MTTDHNQPVGHDGARERSRSRRFRLATLGSVIVLGAGVAAAAGGLAVDPPARANLKELSTYHPNDIEFFEDLRSNDQATLGGAREESYSTLDEAARSASLVLVARVVSIGPGHTVTGEVSSDVASSAYVDLAPVEVLTGEIPEDSQERVTVMFASLGEPDAIVERAESSLPDGASVWFLRSGKELWDHFAELKKQQGRELTAKEMGIRASESKVYITISRFGLLTQGRNAVVAPLTVRGNGQSAKGMIAQAQNYRQLGSLVQHLRGVEGWDGEKPGPL